MSVVFVLTDKGWVDEGRVRQKEWLYCFNSSSGGLDRQQIETIEDISQYDTYKVFNRQTHYTTYANTNTGLVVIDDNNHQCYHTELESIERSRAQAIDTHIPTSIQCINESVRRTKPERSYDRDIKLRQVGMLHFEMDQSYALDYINKWRMYHQRLNGIDYNQALMLQLVALKSGKLSCIEQDIGFDVKLTDTKLTRITDIVKSGDVKIRKRFESENGLLVPIRQINGQVMIG